jgi:acylphosphatase
VKHLDIRVTGRVQGVYFRASTREAAQAIGVKGTVRNEADGSVFIEAEGTDEQLRRFLEWVRRGPPGARVDSVSPRPGEPRGFDRFDVVR